MGKHTWTEDEVLEDARSRTRAYRETDPTHPELETVKKKAVHQYGQKVLRELELIRVALTMIVVLMIFGIILMVQQ